MVIRFDLAVSGAYIVRGSDDLFSARKFPHGKAVNPFDWRRVTTRTVGAHQLIGFHKLLCDQLLCVTSGDVRVVLVDEKKEKIADTLVSGGEQVMIPCGSFTAVYSQKGASWVSMFTEVIDSVDQDDLGWDDSSLRVQWNLAEPPVVVGRPKKPAEKAHAKETLQIGSSELANQAARAHGSAAKKIWYAPNFFEAFGEDEIRAVNEALRFGALVSGPKTEEFERLVASYFGKKHALFVNSGSSANLLGLLVLDLPAGAEVVTPACTFATTVAPIEQLGLKPVFIDVELNRYVPSVDAIIGAITPKTKVLMIPNLIGSKIDWAEVRKRITALGRTDIVLFEDSCDTMAYTPHSDVAAISFYASHVITAGGIGGCVLFNSDQQLAKALQYRDWGRIGSNIEDVSTRFAHSVDGIEYDFKFLYSVKGYNLKCSEMNAAFGVAQMKKLDRLQQIRRDNIQRYMDRLKGSPLVLPAEHDKHDWLAMPLQYSDRGGLLRFLEGNNVQVRCTFSGNVTRHPAYRNHLQVFPNADTIMKNGFLLGAHHGMTFAEVDRVCDLLLEYINKK